MVEPDPEPDAGTGCPGLAGAGSGPDVCDEGPEPGGVEPETPTGFVPFGGAAVVAVTLVDAELVEVTALVQILEKVDAAAGGGSDGLPFPGFSNRHPSTSPVCIVRLAPELEYVQVPGSPCQ